MALLGPGFASTFSSDICSNESRVQAFFYVQDFNLRGKNPIEGGLPPDQIHNPISVTIHHFTGMTSHHHAKKRHCPFDAMQYNTTMDLFNGKYMCGSRWLLRGSSVVSGNEGATVDLPMKKPKCSDVLRRKQEPCKLARLFEQNHEDDLRQHLEFDHSCPECMAALKDGQQHKQTKIGRGSNLRCSGDNSSKVGSY